MSIFIDRLLLLVHTLLALSKEAPDVVFRTKCQKHLDDEWLQKPIILQCCMSTPNLINSKKVSSLTLSDNGSTLSFVSANFIKKHKLPVMGKWRGNLQTLNDVKNVSTSFYKLVFNTSNGEHPVLCLETSNLGDYFRVNHKMCLKFSSHFGLSPNDVLCTSSKPIDILLGLDATALLLDKIFVLNGRKVSPPAWAPNVFLYGSPASNKFSLVGCLNVHYPVENIRNKNRASGILLR